MTKKVKDLLEITLMYIIIGLSGMISYKEIQTNDSILDFLIADLVMTVVVFIFSLVRKNSSVYDAYWSIIPFYFVLVFVFELSAYLDFAHYTVFFVVSLWAWRLTYSWGRGWPGFHHEDFRYVELANKTGKFYPIVNFLGIHLFPTLMVFGCCMPLFYLVLNPIETMWLLYVGCVVSLIGVWFEFQADNELARFRKRENPKSTDLLRTGIWGRSRNPNYLGEMLFWLGLAIVGFAVSSPWYSYVGVLSLILMFIFISIPMKDERMQKGEKQGYSDYKKTVPVLFPRIF